MYSRNTRPRAQGGALVAGAVPFALFLLLTSSLGGQQPAQALEGYQYVSPIPSSRLVSRWNNVAIRQGEMLDAATIDPASISVVGAESGGHSGDFVLADDSRTLVFNPHQPYAPGETVFVTLATGTRTSGGTSLPHLAFSFSVASDDPARETPLCSEGLDSGAPRPGAAQFPSRAATVSDPNAAMGALPPDYPLVTLIASDHPEPGYVFISPRTNYVPSALLIIDNHAMPLFYRRVPYQLLGFMMQPNGRLTYFDSMRRKHYALDSSYAVVDSFAAGNGYWADFHDFQLLPNGHALLLAYDDHFVRMDLIVPGGDREASVAGLVVQEIDAAKNVVFQWRSWDHFEITDAVSEDLTASFIDYVHGNAVERDTDGNLLISSRHLNEITKINRQTGAVIWRFGRNAKNNQFQIINDPRGFGYQHDIRRLPNGHITLFDNGNYLSPQTSRAVEYELDEQNRVARLVWENQPSQPGWGNSNGNVQRRPSGGTMISWGAGTVSPNVTDLHADGTRGLVLHVGTTTYRAFRYPWETRRFVTNTKRLDFGTVRVGDRDTLPLTVTNRVATSVRITSFVSLDSSSLSVTRATPITIPPFGTISVGVVFHPDTLGDFDNTLYIRSERDSEIVAQDVLVEGEGVTGVLEVAVTSPNGGETCAIGGPIDLMWNAAQGVGETTVDLFVSTTGVDGPFEAITLGAANTGKYSWQLNGPATTQAYLKVVARDAPGGLCSDVSDSSFTILPHNTGVGEAPAGDFMLGPVSPNPTRGMSRIEYTVPRTSLVRLSVFDIDGRRVALLADGDRGPGRHHATWDGGRGSRRAPPGVYLVHFEAGGLTFVRRVVMFR